MKSPCRGCGQYFSQSKSFHKYCSNCFGLLCKCLECGRAVFPKDDSYSCCGITETTSHVREAESRRRVASQAIGRAIDSMMGFETVPIGLLESETHGPNGLYFNSEEEELP